MPGTRLTLTRNLRNVGTLTGPYREVLATHRARTISLRTGQVLHLDRGRGSQLTDSGTGDPVLWLEGTNFNGWAGGHVLFPEGRYIVFPVKGTQPRHAVMTAVSESGQSMLRFRNTPGGVIEIVVSPDCALTPEVLCAITLTASWLHDYFASPGGGG